MIRSVLRAWPAVLLGMLRNHEAVVRVVLAGVRGSAPREAGVGMLVSGVDVVGTIGGGELEWRAVRAATAMLNTAAVPGLLERLVLAADLAQCCGGVVDVWMERYTRADETILAAAAVAILRGPVVLQTVLAGATLERRLIGASSGDPAVDALLSARPGRARFRLERTGTQRIVYSERVDEDAPPLWLYGAGHVGQALARILGELPFALTWIDERRGLLPAGSAPGVHVRHEPDPVASVVAAPAGTYFLVLTHSHALDFDLCLAILRRVDFAWAGLIGSASKAARFRSRLARAGLSAASIARLVCPIGIAGITSKWPASIAVGVAAQLLRTLGADATTAPAIRLSEVGAGEQPGASAAADACASAGGCASAGACGAVEAPTARFRADTAC